MLHLLLALSLFSSKSVRPASHQKTSLRVEVQNVRVLKGAVYVTLYRPGKDFPGGNSIDDKKINAGSKSVQTLFSVEPGDYAIAVYHDQNGNGKMDKRVFGIPKEPYGFSNNFKPLMSAPRFSDCQFSVSNGGKTISIKLI